MLSNESAFSTDLVHEELVEDGGLAGVVQTHDADLVLWKATEKIVEH